MIYRTFIKKNQFQYSTLSQKTALQLASTLSYSHAVPQATTVRPSSSIFFRPFVLSHSIAWSFPSLI